MRNAVWFFLLVGLSALSPVNAHDQEGGAIAALSAGARSYRLLTSQNLPLDQIDSQGIKSAYAKFAYRQHLAAATAVSPLEIAITTFLERPDRKTLANARKAWLSARPAYLHTEIFRFYEGPIDASFVKPNALRAQLKGAGNYESRINAWPLNEAALDYVKGSPNSGLVQNLALPMTASSILAMDQARDESDVTTGWHAIEFLLWGQDFARNGAGNRPASDFAATSAVNERRRLLLQTLVSMLRQDLTALADAWDPARSDNYFTKFVQIDAYEAIGRMLTGAAMLAGNELASERLSVALDSGTQEDETSCFSDSSSNDLRAGVAGVAMLFDDDGAGLLEALAIVDPSASKRLRAALGAAIEAVAQIATPFDQVLASNADSTARANAEQAVTALQALAKEISTAGRSFGVLVSVPGL